jgi:choline dehydrogenase-like flavoprotein
VHLPKALAAGAVLVHGATVVRILTDSAGTYATGVEVVLADGTRQNVFGDVVILAAFAIQNPRLLLASATDKHQAGLGNGHGLVGRFLMSHAAGLVYGLFNEETRHYQGAFGGQLVNQDSYAKTTHRQASAFGSYQWMIAQAVKPNDLLGIATTRSDLFGNDLHTFMRRAAQGFASMTAVVEDLPLAENRVSLASDVDAHGVPLAVAHHSAHAESQALWQASLVEGRAIFEAAGAAAVWTGPPGPMHIMGGTIMGGSEGSSVTNSYGQLHDISNLLVAGPGLFPTSAGVNPTYTVHALAARSAAYLLANWSSVVH